MTIKNDLKDIGYLLITPNPKKFRFEGVNYRRAGIQLIVGSLAVELLLGTAYLYGPQIAEVIVEKKDKLKKQLKK